MSTLRHGKTVNLLKNDGLSRLDMSTNGGVTESGSSRQGADELPKSGKGKVVLDKIDVRVG